VCKQIQEKHQGKTTKSGAANGKEPDAQDI
jgi:hypothetical protein